MDFEKDNELHRNDTRAIPEINVKDTDSSFYNSEPNFTQSSLPDVKESDEVQYPQPSAQLRRDSLSWTEQLTVDYVTDRESIVEEDEEEEETEDGDEEVKICDSSEMDATLLDLQFGIRKSLERLPTYPDRDLLMTDFSMIEEISFSSGPNQTSFLIKVYAPVAFRYFRELFGITSEDFQYSICDTPLINVNTNSRSGSIFFTTRDDRFILKTVPKKEADFLIALFPGYFLNLTQHKKTLLPKYYGLFSYVRGVKTIRVLIMNNILPSSCNFFHKYDLKGSTYSKRKQLKNREPGQIKTTLKDLDFLENWPDGFFLPPDIHRLLIRSIERDCKVLESYNIMDYSLLLGIVLTEGSNSPVRPSKRDRFSFTLKKQKNLIGPFGARTGRGDSVFLFMGIIDILQSYNWKKKLECQFKSLFYSKSTISVNRPDFYSHRFQKFLREHVFKFVPRYASSASREYSANMHKPNSSNAFIL